MYEFFKLMTTSSNDCLLLFSESNPHEGGQEQAIILQRLLELEHSTFVVVGVHT